MVWCLFFRVFLRVHLRLFGLVGFVVWFLFFQIAACVGLLVSGCSFSGHFSTSRWSCRRGWNRFLYPRLSFDMSGASTFSVLGDHFGTLRAPWGTMGAARRSHWVQNRISFDFETICRSQNGVFLELTDQTSYVVL